MRKEHQPGLNSKRCLNNFKWKWYLLKVKKVHFLFIFMDGVGLGANEPEANPFAWVSLPNLENLLDQQKLISKTVNHGPLHTTRTSLAGLDACLGVNGLPQSATGQAVLLTGKNVPAEIGYHYGPKPNPEIAAYLKNGNLFSSLIKHGYQPAFLNAYPPPYFRSIQTGRRLYSAIPQAAVNAGLSLRTDLDLKMGHAVAADFTAEGWHSHLNLPETPRLSPVEAGERLAHLGLTYDFSLFEFWLSDYVGHHQDMEAAVTLLQTFDQVLGGLIGAWKDEDGLILITSDHGNLEDLSTRRHTANPVPAMLIGAEKERQAFMSNLDNLTGITPKISEFFENNSKNPHKYS
jgi:hypothetical protein